jgi:predicted CopG family antitoxin
MNKTNNRQEIEKSNKLTTISISKENYFILKKMGQTSDSFNDVLSRLLKNNYLLESDRS